MDVFNKLLYLIRKGKIYWGQLSSVNYDDGNYEWFTYDKLGRITQAENPTSQTLWEYDVLGRIVAETQNGHRISHQYNAYGNRTAMESSLGAKLQHTYNEWGEWVMFQMCC